MSPSLSALAALRERLENATGPNFALERDLHVALVGSMYEPETLERVGYKPPAYTGSLDAVLALVERSLPGWGWSVASDMGEGRVFGAALSPLGLKSAALNTETARAPTPALAACLALIRALEAQAQEDGK